MIYTCGGCGKLYESFSHDNMTQVTCPRCNPGKTLNYPIDHEAGNHPEIPARPFLCPTGGFK